MRSWRGNETLVIYSDNGTVGLREWAMICGSQAQATVGHNYHDDREVMSIPTTISWHPGVLPLLVTPSSQDVPRQDVATIRNMTSISSNVTRQIKSNPGLGSSSSTTGFLPFVPLNLDLIESVS